VAVTVILEFVDVTKVKVPVCGLSVRGANTTLNATVCPGLKLRGRSSPWAENAHGPAFSLRAIFKVEEPVFVKLTAADWEPPTGTEPKLTEQGPQARADDA
jgi:hypothetical protein